MKILLVDDDRDFAESLEDVLSLKGHTVSLCFDPLQALNSFEFKQFDLILLDFKMNGMNGAELFMQIKQLDPKAKVLLLTAYSLQSFEDQAIDNGLYGILQKPLQFDTLFHLIDSAAKSLILIVDDNKDFCESLEELLQTQGHRTLTAFSGEQAWLLCQRSDIDVLILDIKLPDIDGFELLTRINEYNYKIPIFMVSAYSIDYHLQIRDCIESNSSTRFLTKPINTQHLLDQISATLRC